MESKRCTNCKAILIVESQHQSPAGHFVCAFEPEIIKLSKNKKDTLCTDIPKNT